VISEPPQIAAVLARGSDMNGGRSKAMRFGVALSPLIALCASADAATVHHSRPRHVIVHPSQGLTLRHAVPGRAYAAPRPAIHDYGVPSYNDPSKFGGM
jgi:hypothetical protein